MTERILHVDDDETGRYVISSILRRAGFDVVEATNGRQALEYAKHIPELILLDINLPDLDGFEVCRRLKSDPLTAAIPVLHISATRVDSAATVAGLEGGADGYLTQPVDPSVIVATIRALLRARRAESELAVAGQYWQITFDSIIDPICLTDQQDKILKSNKAFQDFTRMTAPELGNRPIKELFNGKDWPELTGPQPDLEWNEQWYRVRISPIDLEQEGIKGKVYLFINITERKKVEQDRESMLKEKELLLQETHHRVKNNLQVITSLLNLQCQKVSNLEVLEVLVESRNRIKSMALIHESLNRTNSTSGVNLTEYLKALVDQLFQSYNLNGNVKVSFEADAVTVDLDKAMPLGLIVNELLSNSLKYGCFPGDKGEIAIQLRKHDSSAVIKITDNGPGLPSDIDLANSATLGLKLVHLLAAQIESEVQLDRTQPGAHFSIKFSCSSCEERLSLTVR